MRHLGRGRLWEKLSESRLRPDEHRDYSEAKAESMGVEPIQRLRTTGLANLRITVLPALQVSGLLYSNEARMVTRYFISQILPRVWDFWRLYL